MEDEKTLNWIIEISRYGIFTFRGTEAEAEAVRANKSKWEGGFGTKRIATDADLKMYGVPE